MKSLEQYIEESLLDDIDTLSKNADKAIKQEIKQFLKDNFNGASKCKISKNLNDDGKYVVDCAGDIKVKNRSITSLTNDLFVWGKFDKGFDCSYCDKLTSLKDAPKEVGGNFYCCYCDSLTSLEGAPKEVGWYFMCHDCSSLTSLEGAPEKVGGDFNCKGCRSLKSYDINSNIKGKFIK